MPEIYRYRSTDAVLDGFHELERQEIYFSPIEELNDPMEGYKDVFWKGDAVVWHNLLRHFVLCTMLMAHNALGGPDFGEDDLRKSVFVTPESFDDPGSSVRQIYEEISAEFFKSPGIDDFVCELAARSYPIRREELAHYLRAIHPYTISVVFRHRSLRELMKSTYSLDSLEEQLKRITASLEALKRLSSGDRQSALALFVAGEVVALKHELTVKMSGERISPGIVAMTSPAFSSRYVRALNGLVHWPAYYACFSRTATNASMWAHYADSHRGVCLRFTTTQDSSGRSALPLRTVTGVSGGRASEDVMYHHSMVDLPVRDVVYESAYPKIDFFRSIGRLPQPALNEFWFRDETGRESPIRATIAKDEKKWRKGYWDTFEAGLICKTEDWSHEREARVVLHSMLDFLDEPARRALRYEFRSLTGIAFGANTRDADKIAIAKIISEKCKVERRTEFSFFQTIYLRDQKRFHLMPILLL